MNWRGLGRGGVPEHRIAFYPALCTSHKSPRAMCTEPETLAHEADIHKHILAPTSCCVLEVAGREA